MTYHGLGRIFGDGNRLPMKYFGSTQILNVFIVFDFKNPCQPVKMEKPKPTSPFPFHWGSKWRRVRVPVSKTPAGNNNLRYLFHFG